MNENLYAVFAARWHGAAARTLLETPEGAVLRYGDAERESGRLARALRARGLRPGARVSVQVEKSPAGLLLYLACLRAGLVYQPLNPAYAAAELEFFIQDAAPDLVIHDPGFAVLPDIAARAGIARLTLDTRGEGSLADAARAEPADFETAAVPGAAPAALLYSSGTTGRPKGICLSHGNLRANAEALAESWGFGPTDVLLHALPMFHVHGLFIALGCPLMSASSMLFLEKFEVPAVLAALPAATVFMGVPTYYTRLLAEADFDTARAPRIRLWVSGSAPLLPATFEAFEARVGARILERYGMTETGVIASNPLHGERRAGSVGPPLPGVAVRVMDEQGGAVAAGERGHVQVRGANVFAGYWGSAGAGHAGFTADGWFDTGDDGRIDADGFLWLAGRSMDLIITGGLNVYPLEIEQALDRLPGVRESAVIGLPHADFGEQVVAVIVLEAGATLQEGDWRAALANVLARYKQPKRYIPLDALPRNALGKVQKNVLRAQFATT